MFPLAELRSRLKQAARHGVLLGCSSWKYTGWLGQIYSPDRYLYRGKVAASRFERNCLAEYAETFPTVCVDAGYYAFPKEEQLLKLDAQTPPHFRFSFKVTDEITLKHFPSLPRFGPRAGQRNPDFLNPERFITDFLGPLRAIREKTGVLIFEFSRFKPTDFTRGSDFVRALDSFLAALPADWRYGVEIRNRTFLHPEYFATLARHRVAHVLTSWTRMPPLREQLAMPGSLTSPHTTAARLLLKPGRSYQQAVDSFSPYESIREPLPETRSAAAALIQNGLKNPAPAAASPPLTFIYVNNRMEGNAPATLLAMLQEARP